MQRNEANLDFLYQRYKNQKKKDLAFDACLNLINFYLERGIFIKANNLIENALNYFVSLEKIDELNYQKSIILYSLGQQNKAIQLLEKVSKSTTKEHITILKSLTFLTTIFNELNQSNRSKIYQDKVEKLLKGISTIKLKDLIVILKNRVIVSENCNEQQLRIAVAQLNDILVIGEKNGINKKPFLSEVYELLGKAYQYLKFYNDAFENFDKAFEINNQLGFTQKIIQNLNDLGTLCLEHNFFDDAERYSHNSLQLSKHITDNKELQNNYSFREKYAQAGINQISAFCGLGQQKNILKSCEKHQYSILLNKLSKQLPSHQPKYSQLNIQGFLNDEEIAIYFLPIQFNILNILVVNKQNIETIRVSLDKYIEQIFELFGNEIQINELEDTDEIPENLLKIFGYESTNFSKRVSKFDMVLRYFNSLLNDVYLLDDMLIDNRTMELKYENDKDDLDQMINKIKQIGNILYQALFPKKLQESLVQEKIIIIPSIDFSYLPFECLVNNDDKYLIESFDIQYTHSLNIRNIQKLRHSNATKEACIIGSPSYKEDNFKDAYKEIIEFMGIFSNAIPITEKQVNKRVIQDKFSDKNKYYSVVHFATHGKGYLEYPELSLLILSDTVMEQKPYLFAKEVEKLHIKANLVILAACETSLSKNFQLEGSQGLKESFILAGAKGVISTLWKVENTTTSEFTSLLHRKISFYSNDVSKHLSEIKRKFINHKDIRKRHPAFWAAYQYFGI